MFEVMYGSNCYKVYSVRDNKDYASPDFLIYIDYHWTWVPCIYCTPTT